VKLAFVGTLVLALFAAAPDALACTCITPGPACQAFWKTDAVFDATVERIEPTSHQERLGSSDREFTFPEKLVHLDVRKAWKGVSEGPLDVVTAADGPACGYDFKPGGRYLVFAFKNPATGRWVVSSCSATMPFDGSGEAANFLASLAEPTPGGRIFGSVTSDSPTFNAEQTPVRQNIEARVRLLGDGRERSAVSTGGRFEFSRLAPGPYRLELQLPDGYTTYQTTRTVDVASDRSCSAEDFWLTPAGRLTGHVLDATGHPAERVRIEATTPDARAHPVYGLPMIAANTDSYGDFEIHGLPPGRYIVGVNLADLPSHYAPIGRTLYPSDGSEGTILTLGTGQSLDLGAWKLPPPLPVVTLTGLVVWQDGTPAAGAYVGAWDRTGNPVATARGAGGDKADAEGRFSIELRQGRVYTFSVRDKASKLVPIAAPRVETGPGPLDPIRIVIRQLPPR